MKVFTTPESLVHQALITDQAFSIEIIKNYNNKIFIVSAEKEITVYDQVSFRQAFDKKLCTSSPINCVAFYGDKVYCGLRNSTVEIFTHTDLDLIAAIKMSDAVTSMLTLNNHGIVTGLDNGELHIIDVFTDKVTISERHPFSEKITQIMRTSRSGAGQSELAIITAGQIYFTTIVMKSAKGIEQGIEVPK